MQGEEALRRALAGQGVRMSRPLGFNKTDALGMREERDEEWTKDLHWFRD